MTTEEYRSSPPIPADLATTPAVAAHRQETIDTVQRIMGEDIAPRENRYDQFGSPRTGDPAQIEDTSTTQVAKDQAAQVADTAKQAGSQVAGTVTEQAGQVTAEAGKQAKQLLTQAQSEVTEQAAATQQRVADGLHSLADELAGMADKSEQDGVATDIACLRMIPVSTVREVRLERATSSVGRAIVAPNGDVLAGGNLIIVTTRRGGPI